MDDEDDLAPGSLVRRWRLGKQLRELREAAGKNMTEAAKYIGLTQPTLSRIETGKHAILPRNVRQLCQCYGIGAPLVDTLIRQAEEASDRGWWMTYSDTMPDWFETFVGFETDASVIFIYECELIPGLLQTADFTRLIRAAQGPASEPELAKSVEFRQARQQRLTSKPPELHVVLNEAALRRPVGGPETMAAQIEHLISVARQPWASIQILPFRVGPHAGIKGPFMMLTLPGEAAPNMVYLEQDHGAIYLDRQSDLVRYAQVFESLVNTALAPTDSIEFMTTVEREYLGEQKG